MISDLALQNERYQVVDTDFLLIGAGIAGLTIAARLRKYGKRVTVLESGGRRQDSEEHPLNRVIQLGDDYGGAARGRYRCLGGTSTRWGGALLPFAATDMRERPYLGLHGFPVAVDAVSNYLSEVERIFGVARGSYEEDFVREMGAHKYVPVDDDDFKARFAKWPPFKSRNLATVYKDLLAHDIDLAVSLNATVVAIKANTEVGRIESVVAKHESGRAMEVRAEHFIICAGAIETTRLLLMLERHHGSRICQCDALGRYFYDHISRLAAKIVPKNLATLNRMAGFRFVGSTMRSLRFELSAAAQQNEKVASANGHISFRTEKQTGFDALRQAFRSIQRGEWVSPETAFSVVKDVGYLMKMSYWRMRYHQLLWPNPAIHELHIVAEQLPRRDNLIELSSETDALGSPLAAIRWRVSEDDEEVFSVYRRLFSKFWTRHDLDAIGELDWVDGDNLTSARELWVDVYHPGGTTRMGLSRNSSVLNEHMGVFNVPNLWAASTAAFPSGGGANPTLTLILFAMRLADNLGRHTR
jgi:choline dehydrogenase-like flavoprotein